MNQQAGATRMRYSNTDLSSYIMTNMDGDINLVRHKFSRAIGLF